MLGLKINGGQTGFLNETLNSRSVFCLNKDSSSLDSSQKGFIDLWSREGSSSVFISSTKGLWLVGGPFVAPSKID